MIETDLLTAEVALAGLDAPLSLPPGLGTGNPNRVSGESSARLASGAMPDGEVPDVADEHRIEGLDRLSEFVTLVLCCLTSLADAIVDLGGDTSAIAVELTRIEELADRMS